MQELKKYKITCKLEKFEEIQKKKLSKKMNDKKRKIPVDILMSTKEPSKKKIKQQSQLNCGYYRNV